MLNIVSVCSLDSEKQNLNAAQGCALGQKVANGGFIVLPERHDFKGTTQ